MIKNRKIPMGIFLIPENKKDSEYGEYYLLSEEGDIYSGEVGFVILKFAFEGIRKYYTLIGFIGMGVNIKIRLYFPKGTILNLLKDNNIMRFFKMGEIYNSLPEEYRWWRIGEGDIEGMSKVLKKKLISKEERNNE